MASACRLGRKIVQQGCEMHGKAGPGFQLRWAAIKRAAQVLEQNNTRALFCSPSVLRVQLPSSRPEDLRIVSITMAEDSGIGAPQFYVGPVWHGYGVASPSWQQFAASFEHVTHKRLFLHEWLPLVCFKAPLPSARVKVMAARNYWTGLGRWPTSQIPQMIWGEPSLKSQQGGPVRVSWVWVGSTDFSVGRFGIRMIRDDTSRVHKAFEEHVEHPLDLA